jgi:hypothetical protein
MVSTACEGRDLSAVNQEAATAAIPALLDTAFTTPPSGLAKKRKLVCELLKQFFYHEPTI